MNRRGLRPVALLAAMLGFGLRLDTDWQGMATLLLVVAGVLGVIGASPGAGPAFVQDDERR